MQKPLWEEWRVQHISGLMIVKSQAPRYIKYIWDLVCQYQDGMSITPARTFHVWWSCMLAVQPSFVHAILSLKCLCKGDSPVALLHIMLGEQSWSCSSVPAWCKCTTDHASVREKTITASKLVGIYWFIWMTCLVYFVACLCYLSFLSEEAIFLACSYKNSAVSCKAGWTLWRKRPCGTLIWFSSPWML